MNYGEIIIKLRAKLNVTQDVLAKKLSVSFATINRWENGHVVPSKRYIYILEQLCKENNIDWSVRNLYE